MMKDTMPGPPHSGLGPRPGLGGEGWTGRLSYCFAVYTFYIKTVH